MNMLNNVKRPGVFFDRDGVLNIDKGFVHSRADFEWVPGAREAVRFCNKAGYFVFAITNQSGVARGYFSEKDVEDLHDYMREELKPFGAHIDAFAYCPHHPDAALAQYRKICPRRKPSPGMILDIMRGWPVDPGQSFVIGNELRDIEAANAAGIRGYLFEGGRLDQFVASVVGAREQTQA